MPDGWKKFPVFRRKDAKVQRAQSKANPQFAVTRQPTVGAISSCGCKRSPQDLPRHSRDDDDANRRCGLRISRRPVASRLYNAAMNSPRFYCPLPLTPGALAGLPENAARHACRVLRLRVGDSLTLFDGQGGEYVGRIAVVERERVTVEVLAWQAVERESALSLTLVQALQAGEKMDLTVQKAVELGVSRIVPVASRRSVLRLEGERAVRRLAHWRGVVASACEQCGRNRLPEVTAIEKLERWLERPMADTAMRLMLAPEAGQSLADLTAPTDGRRIELLIGAEGGLAPEEMEQAAAAGFVPIRLGPRILRTETAGLAALAAIQCLWGDFEGREKGEATVFQVKRNLIARGYCF